MNKIQLLEKLRKLGKPYYDVADLEKILGLGRKSLYVTLNRLVDSGVLLRLKRGVYKEAFSGVNFEKIANELYYPSYLSFESALSRYGILNQIPYTLTFATTKRSKKIVLADTEVEYRQLKKDYFFGYTLSEDVYVAEPEKALLDELYFMSRGKAELDIEELDLRMLNLGVLKKYAKKFPTYVMNLLDGVKTYIGTTPVTLETKERIRWKAKGEVK